MCEEHVANLGHVTFCHVHRFGYLMPSAPEALS